MDNPFNAVTITLIFFISLTLAIAIHNAQKIEKIEAGMVSPTTITK